MPQGSISLLPKAISLLPKVATAHVHLGSALYAKGDVEGAIRSFRESIRLDPRFANAHAALGVAFIAYGDFANARRSLRQAGELFPPKHPLQQVVTGQLALCQQLLGLEQTLDAVLAGKRVAKDSRERLALAGIAVLPAKQLHVTAVRFYREAFQAQPALATDLRFGHRYNAACAAARAGTGQSKDTASLDETARAEMRYRALCWLQDDLGARARQLTSLWPGIAAQLRQTLLHWQKDADLTVVRDLTALGKLPEAEQVAWRNLWAQVDALLARTRSGK